MDLQIIIIKIRNLIMFYKIIEINIIISIILKMIEIIKNSIYLKKLELKMIFILIWKIIKIMRLIK